MILNEFDENLDIDDEELEDDLDLDGESDERADNNADLNDAENVELLNEICFVWAPHCLASFLDEIREASEADARVQTILLPLEIQDPQPALSEVLSRLSQTLENINSEITHIYCELPWDVTYEDSVLDDWIENRPEFSDGDWHYSFVAIAPLDAERLPSLYREGLRMLKIFRIYCYCGSFRTRRRKAPWVNTEKLDFRKTYSGGRRGLVSGSKR